MDSQLRSIDLYICIITMTTKHDRPRKVKTNKPDELYSTMSHFYELYIQMLSSSAAAVRS
jgi:hypothetical protein